MDWLTAVVECVKALVWPIVVGTLIISQREPIGKLISGLKPKSAKGFGAEIDFEQKIDHVEDTIEAAKEELTAPAKPQVRLGIPAKDLAGTAATFAEFEQKLKEVTTHTQIGTRKVFHSADLQIERTWSRIEKLLQDLLDQHDEMPPFGPGLSVRKMLQAAHRHGILPASVSTAIQELYNLRNKVVHTGYDALTMSDAERFAESARTVEVMLEFFLRAAKDEKAGRNQND